jgi:hypothetical protein
MKPLITSTVGSAPRPTAETLHDSRAQDVDTTDVPVAMPARPTPGSTASSSLEGFVPAGGLHPIVESHAKRNVSVFLRRVWRDGTFCSWGHAGR